MYDKPKIKSRIPYSYYIGAIKILTISCLSINFPATAQISADRTLPTPSEVSPGKTQGLDFLITGGTTAGNNLFHSFEGFSVPTNGSAIFQNDLNVAKIINRVTGGWESNIDGLIQAQGNANFFLINPNGIIFGRNASLNIGGSFIASTASSIKLDNKDEFSATNPQPPLLTVSVPLGVQFGNKAESIVNQSQVTDVRGRPAGLQGLPNSTLALIGGEVKGERGNITVPDGRIELGSVEKNSFVSLIPNSQGFALGYANDQKFEDIHLDGSLLDVTGLSGGGNIQLQGGTVSLNQSGLFARTSPFGTQSGGEISIKGNQLNINNSTVQTITFGATQGGDVTLAAKKVAIQGPWTMVSAETKDTGNGGKLTIRADDVQLNDLSILGTESSGLGNAGDVLIEAQKVTIRDGSQVTVNALAEGSGGILVVKASESIDLVGDGELFGNRFSSGLVADTEGGGKAAEVRLETGKLTIQDGARISASTFADADAGKVNIQATEVELIGTAITGKPSGVFNQVEATATGQGGDITFATEKLLIQGGAQVSVSTFGYGDAGRISVIAPQSVEVRGKVSDATPSGLFAQVDSKPGVPSATGRGGNIFLDTGKLILQGGGVRVSATTADAGAGGNVSIKTNDLLVQDGAQIQAATRGFADGGKVEVTADTIELIGANVFPSALVTSTAGDAAAGNLTVTTKNLLIQNGGRISASTFGAGAGGEININAFNVQLIGTSARGEFASGLFSETQGLGDGGKLNISTDKLLITNGARVSADTFAGVGGSISLIANSLEVNNGGQLRTNTAGNSNGGNITMKVKHRILLTGNDSGIFASTTADSQGNGGKIDINPISLMIRDGATIGVDSQGTGTGGDILFNAESLTLDRGKISAQTRSNTGGNITLQVQNLLLLRNSSQISTSAGNRQFGGDGGNITISSPFIVAPPIENSDITANAFMGRGGNIQITTESMFGIIQSDQLTNFSDITASSTFGVNGVIEINSPEVDASQGLTELPEKVTDASKMIARGCQAILGEDSSNFLITGRGGLPPSPDGILSGNGMLPDLATTPIMGTTNLYKAPVSTKTISHPWDSLVEAQGMALNDKGQIVLIAQAPNLNSHSSWLPSRNCHGN
ncbi:MAG: filamentous hemagglutinin N-terminal domain-containing protein [Nostocaceae cyanobacterium]|nr:filamentous hemagglutinin N-terminal domain-containing protein [Nostocaceae cyanobacterium]